MVALVFQSNCTKVLVQMVIHIFMYGFINYHVLLVYFEKLKILATIKGWWREIEKGHDYRSCIASPGVRIN